MSASPPTFGKYSLRQNVVGWGIPEDTVPDGTVLHLAILGNGYFVVRDAETNDYRVTQVGHFMSMRTGICQVIPAGVCKGARAATSRPWAIFRPTRPDFSPPRFPARPWYVTRLTTGEKSACNFPTALVSVRANHVAEFSGSPGARP